MNKIRIGILGYGNLGRGVEQGILQNKDMELVGVFTRRNPIDIQLTTKDAKAYHIKDAKEMTDIIDVMILCGGSKSDLPTQGPEFAGLFNTVDGFDTHANIPQYYDAVNDSALKAKKTAVIASGWDPGMFSLNRLYAEAILPKGKGYTFWGKGVSQGHSDAIRRIEGVVDAKQYTIPIEEAMDRVRKGELPDFTPRQKHLRECFVVAEDGADLNRIENEIKSMPNYFSDYDTIVHFISKEELEKNHSKMPHGGVVIHSGKTGLNDENNHLIEYSIKLDANPDFTANVLLAYARAVYRLNKEGIYGAKTVFDIAPAYLSIKSDEELRRTLL
ncbi:diaminopimelate dehydrogenase [Herbinix luporum]|uniref:diaminopimelate dehydrogenase n=1 Tax=Herbinix luporum TaxID=1679721 RepID=UPI0017544D8A|nr:diaminopimelate dehydrogenase [Herbinix luporum]HHT56976.1 diaminopimelate dehydrogenase [Herbinix luporum]